MRICKWDLAQADYEKCVEFSKNPPPGEPKIYLAVVLTDLGLLLEDKGDYDAALPSLEQ